MRLEPPSIAAWPFIVGIRLYQALLGPFMGGHCRFHPTCSEYALEAYRTHNPLRATWLTLGRIGRCQPFGGKGYDPVPPREARASGR
jgi:putative membrane protein insertion efficiency factor